MADQIEQKLRRSKITLGIGALLLIVGIYARINGLLTFYLRPWAPHAFNLDLIVIGAVTFLVSISYYLKLRKYTK